MELNFIASNALEGVNYKSMVVCNNISFFNIGTNKFGKTKKEHLIAIAHDSIVD